MKCYNLNDTILFGKFKGHPIAQIIEIEHTYIDWCINNLDHFYVTDDLIKLISEKYPTFVLTEATKAILENKKESWINQNSRYNEPDDRPSYGRYGGSYAQDSEGLSDNFIDDVLDGCPDAYWNID